MANHLREEKKTTNFLKLYTLNDESLNNSKNKKKKYLPTKYI
jgi:hypothetical protein